MEYTRPVTDYDTGEVYRTTIGEHLTFPEFADRLDVGRRTLAASVSENMMTSPRKQEFVCILTQQRRVSAIASWASRSHQL